MTNTRLIETLESNNALSSQFNFRNKHLTINSLLSLRLEVEEDFSHKEHLIFKFLDLRKAYDTTERGCALGILKGLGIGRNFLNYSLERGTPQGSLISVTLFLLAINEITSNIQNPIKCFLFEMTKPS